MNDFIPQIQPWINDRELFYLKKVIESTYVTEHKLTEEFEQRIKKLTGARHAIAMTNGTMALYACFKALDIGPGDEVIVPNITFIATSNAVLMTGATPVFCEIDSNTFCIDPDEIVECITEKTKAIVPVHLYGQSCDMKKIMNIAHQHSLFVVEDAAQGVGVKYDNKHVGTFGDLGILSFYGNKTITCGEGGVVLTNNKELNNICYRLKNHGRDKKGVFIHEHIGYNFCFTEMQAAIGLAQLDKLNSIIDRKKQIHDTYVQEFKHIKDVFKPAYIDERSTPVFWFTSFLTEHKEELQTFLREKNIQTRDFFYPLNMQPCYKNIVFNSEFPTSKAVYNQGISLPSSYDLKDEQQQHIVKMINNFFKNKE